MKTIKTTVDDATYSSLVAMRKAEGVPSVSALFLRKCSMLNQQKEAELISKKAMKAALSKANTLEYCLKDLFDKNIWVKFSKSGRIGAGRAFNSAVNVPGSGIVEVGKSSSNHMFYRTL